MAKVRQTVKTRTRKIPDGNVKCNMCAGKGYHKAPRRSGRRK